MEEINKLISKFANKGMSEHQAKSCAITTLREINRNNQLYINVGCGILVGDNVHNLELIKKIENL